MLPDMALAEFKVTTSYYAIPMGLSTQEYRKLFSGNKIKIAMILNGTICYETEATFEDVEHGKPRFKPLKAGVRGYVSDFNYYAFKCEVDIERLPAPLAPEIAMAS